MATCNAGHGCTITCPNGCGAVYDHETGTCTKWCSESPGKSLSLAEGSLEKVTLTRESIVSMQFDEVSVGALVEALDRSGFLAAARGDDEQKGY